MQNALRLLILEDLPSDAELALRTLGKAGFACRADIVATREAFLAKLAAEAYDLVLADYNLPDFTGRDALEQVRRSDPLLPFILFSGALGEERAVEIVRAGATDYVLKDRPARLGAAVRRALEEAREHRAHLATQQALERSEGRLRVLSRRLLEVQEAERRHLSRELHDEVGQALTAVKLSLEMLARQASDAAVLECARAGVEAAGTALTRVRQLSLSLRPTQLDDLGLVAALRSHLGRQAALGGLQPHFRADGVPERLGPAVETTCFRVAQEALTNVLRHAQAKCVWLDLSLEHGTLVLAVRDDGGGFDVAAAEQRTGRAESLGIVSMQERVALLGGSLELRSAPGAGATVTARLPAAGK